MSHIKIDIQRIEWLLVDAGICPGELVKGENERQEWNKCKHKNGSSCDECISKFLAKYEQEDEE